MKNGERSLFLTAIMLIITCTGKTFSQSNGRLTLNNSVADVVNHLAFSGFGESLLPRDDNSAYYNTRLSNIASLMPYHQNVIPAVVVNTLNHMIDEVQGGRTIFYDFYTAQQKQADRAKQKTGLFFFKGRPGAPFAIVCPGGGFSYVGSLHEGFPVALELSKKGYNAFVIRYRTGGERIACEDLAAAIAFVFTNAQALEVNRENYSLLGFSAGARMAARLSSHITFGNDGTGAYGEPATGPRREVSAARNYPKPAMTVILYTGHTDFNSNDPPTFTVAGEQDRIANPATMERRVNAMRAAGIPVEFHRYPNVGHGFALGTGTTAEGWVNNAVRFWEQHQK